MQSFQLPYTSSLMFLWGPTPHTVQFIANRALQQWHLQMKTAFVWCWYSSISRLNPTGVNNIYPYQDKVCNTVNINLKPIHKKSIQVVQAYCAVCIPSLLMSYYSFMQILVIIINSNHSSLLTANLSQWATAANRSSNQWVELRPVNKYDLLMNCLFCHLDQPSN